MKLTKEQALELIKTLSHYQIVCDTSRIPCLSSPVLVEQLREYVVSNKEEPVQVAETNDDVTSEAYVLGKELHELKPCEACIISASVGHPGDEVMLEFECTQMDEYSNVTDLLVSGLPIDHVVFIRRVGSHLYIAENLEGNISWHNFYIEKFPLGWLDLLPNEETLEIE